ncbi:MAG: GTPase HflX [Spirochaetaceae bacterium]|nr:GTPase HflX [Spirochaetaceae bacterium]
MKNNNNFNEETDIIDPLSCDVKKQRAYLVIILEKADTDESAHARVEELHSLTETMGVESIDFSLIRVRKENSATLIGSGKVEELKKIADEKEIDLFIFDNDLSPRIQRNLEEELDICVIDRTEVILQIFADRAATKEASLQVELARLEYSLPRLTRKWTNLSRQRGGAKGNKGGGETQLELDKRLVQSKITKTKSELDTVKKIRESQRKNRLEQNIPSVAIIGYTNSGKSSLLKKLSNSDIYVENQLFATLDTTSKKVKMPSGREMIFTDTVGFVSNLPHTLIDAFKSTLEEATWADVILIITDASHLDLEKCYKTTISTLKDLDCLNKPTVIALNKIDNPLDIFVESRMKNLVKGPFSKISVKEDQGLEELLKTIEDKYYENTNKITFHFPVDRHDLVAYIIRNGIIDAIDYREDVIEVNSRIEPVFMGKVKEFAINYVEKEKVLDWVDKDN